MFRDKKENDTRCFCCEGLLDSSNKKYFECLGLLRNDKKDQVVEEYGYIYCCRFCAKEHEKQLIEDGKIQFEEIGGVNFTVLKDTKFVDKSGEKIWFPKDGNPYFDMGLRRTFNSIQEKKEFMDKHNLISDGSMDGSARQRKYQMEVAREAARDHVRKAGQDVPK